MKIARIPVSTGPKGIPGLVRWIKATHPPIYMGLAQRLSTRGVLNGLGIADSSLTALPTTAADSGKPGIAQTILNTVSELVKVGLPLYQQQKVFDMQLKRAAAGQPMLDTAAVADLSSVKVGVDSATRNTGLMIVGGLAGGFLLYKLVAGGRRS